jgi:iron complex outermembrane receptor protein
VLLIEENMMKSVSSNRSIAAWKPLALASTLTTLAFPVIAQPVADQTLAPVTVSASRFENNPSFAPIGATVITAAQIRDAGIGNVNEAIRKIGGVYGRQNLNGTSDFSLDLRGFGATSDQNLVVMVDGIRISENEQIVSVMSSIPIESVDRIEIVRGGSSVLYGEGATSGTIQIITKRGKAGVTHGSLVAEVGSFNSQELRASVAKGWESFSIDANIASLSTDNYRDNNELKQENFSGGLQWAYADGRIGMRVESSRQDSRLAGGLTYAQFLENPRQTLTPLDYASIDSTRYTLFGEHRFGSLELAADLSYRERNVETNYISYGSPVTTYAGESTQFSPRARYVSETASVRNEIVVGMDFTDFTRRVSSVGSTAVATATQQSQALYARDEIRIEKTRLAFGARHEKFQKDLRSTSSYDQSFSLNAWDLQASYEISPIVNVFAKAGRSYRVANVDDNFGKSTDQVLDPQTSNDLELGTSIGNSAQKITAKIFRHKLKNEIYYDANLFTQVNLDPTEHQGLEVEASTKIAQDFSLSAILQHVSAKFKEGQYAGLEMTLIPKNNATLRLNWLPGNGQSADIGWRWVDSQRFGGDFSNTCSSRIDAFSTFDARYAVRVGAWEWAVSGTNLTDRSYFSQAFGTCINDPFLGAYPESGRAVKVSARLDF